MPLRTLMSRKQYGPGGIRRRLPGPLDGIKVDSRSRHVEHVKVARRIRGGRVVRARKENGRRGEEPGRPMRCDRQGIQAGNRYPPEQRQDNDPCTPYRLPAKPGREATHGQDEESANRPVNQALPDGHVSGHLLKPPHLSCCMIQGSFSICYFFVAGSSARPSPAVTRKADGSAVQFGSITSVSSSVLPSGSVTLRLAGL